MRAKVASFLSVQASKRCYSFAIAGLAVRYSRYHHVLCPSTDVTQVLVFLVIVDIECHKWFLPGVLNFELTDDEGRCIGSKL